MIKYNMMKFNLRCRSFTTKMNNRSYITNLTSHNLVMEIVQNLFIHISYISHTDIMHWKHIWHMNS
jgi:hypothetical protein